MPILSRDKPLKKLSLPELVSWIKELCELWAFERANLSTGLIEIEKELRNASREFLIRT